MPDRFFNDYFDLFISPMDSMSPWFLRRRPGPERTWPSQSLNPAARRFFRGTPPPRSGPVRPPPIVCGNAHLWSVRVQNRRTAGAPLFNPRNQINGLTAPSALNR
jgi:hypothetical protein